MIRKFECKACKTRFEADDTNTVLCPHCQSDNVEYARIHIPSKVIGGVLLIIVIAIGITMWLTINWGGENSSNGSGIELEDTTGNREKIEAEQEYEREVGEIAPSLSIVEQKYDDEKNVYYCRFSVSHPPKEKWKVVISSYHGNKEVAVSENGVFENLPFSPDDGFYRVSLVDASTGEQLCEERDFPGFEKQINIKRPWTAADLTKKINGDESLVDNPYIANNNKVIVVNKPSWDTSETSSIGQVRSYLKQCNLKAKVLSIELDDMNKIKFAKISIDYPSDWIQEDE